MSESLIQIQEPAAPNKNMRAILRTVGANQVYDEVIEIADPATGSTIDPRQIVGLDYITTGKTQPHIIPDGYGTPPVGLGNRLLTAGLNIGADTFGNTQPLTVQGTGGIVPSLQGFLGQGSLTVYAAAYAQDDSGLNIAALRTRRDNNAQSSNTEKLMTLPVRANAAAQAWTEGRVVPLSADLSGLLRSRMDSWLGSAAPTVGQKAMASSIPVAIASDQGAVPISGSVSVSNFPATQPVSGTVAVSNLPATQPVSGTVNSLITDPAIPTQQAGVTAAGQLRVVHDFAQMPKSPWGGGWGSAVGW